MAKSQKQTPTPQKSPQPSTSSDFEKGFAPAGSAQQGGNVQFTPTGQVAPAKSGSSGKEGSKK